MPSGFPLNVESHLVTTAKLLTRAEVLRLGSSVASTRMKFLGSEGKLLSSAAAAYIVS